jgi:hypothetical protein
MSIAKATNTEGFVALKISGKMTDIEQQTIQQAGIKAFEQQQKLRVLLIFENFQGWDKNGHWDDVSFQAIADQHIEKMAVVCEQAWHDEILMFLGDGFRPFPIQTFQPNGIAKAQAWLIEA